MQNLLLIHSKRDHLKAYVRCQDSWVWNVLGFFEVGISQRAAISSRFYFGECEILFDGSAM